MGKRLDYGRLGGVWSATPTPLTEKMRLDKVSVRRLVEHHVRLRVNGLFLCGSCGEGPWMPNQMRREMLQRTAEYNQGRMLLAMQVTDNSEARMLENIELARKDGADIAVVAQPHMAPRGGVARVRQMYLRTIRESPLPIGIYDMFTLKPEELPSSLLREVYAERNVVLGKDSSMSVSRRNIALSVRSKRRGLRLLNGNEWDCVPYLRAGYDGLLLGGGIFNAHLAWQIVAAVAAGDFAEAQRIQDRMTKLMWAVYGGKSIKCWLSGQKKLCVEMGIFQTWKSFLEYPLTASCSKAIDRAVKSEAEVLFPWRQGD